MDWALEFYTKQNDWSGVYEEPIHDGHRLKASWIEELTGPGKKRILELGRTDLGSAAKEQALFYFKSLFAPGMIVEAALRSEG